MSNLNYFQVTAQLLKGGVPFVLYRKPGDDKLKGLIQKNANLNIVDDVNTDRGFVFAPFDDQRHPAVLLRADAELELSMDSIELVEDTVRSIQLSESNTEFAPQMKEEEQRFQRLVQYAVAEIKAEKCKKIVVSRRERLESKQIEVTRIFRELLLKYSSAMVYFWYHPKVGMWMGATPEYLIERKEGALATMALAGTRKQAPEAADWGEKEIEEQRMVSNYIKRIMDKNLIEGLEQEGPRTHQAGNLEHIATYFKAEITEMTNLNWLLNDLHPTPAVGGVPLKAAKSFIDEHENYDREYYSGYLGELNLKENQSSLFVNIRCMQLVKDAMLFYAGCGITEDSEPMAEWEETCQKMNTLKNVVKNYVL